MGEQGPSLGHSLADTLAQILLRPDKRSPFLALGSAAVSGRPAVTWGLEKITGTMFACLKVVGKKKTKTCRLLPLESSLVAGGHSMCL